MARVTVWNEYRHEREHDAVAEHYPDGIHAVVADAIEARGHDVTTATLDEGPDHGLTEVVLDETDVLTWWGHAAHDEVRDAVAERVAQRVRHDGLGLLTMHSGHLSKPFRLLMGTPCDLKWREAAERERLWVVDPGHPIAEGIDDYFEVPDAEMYGEPFGVPEPDRLVFTSWFEGGDVFRSGCCFYRGTGRIFYFRPGHEAYPVYHREEVKHVLGNAVEWLADTDADAVRNVGNQDPIEQIDVEEIGVGAAGAGED